MMVSNSLIAELTYTNIMGISSFMKNNTTPDNFTSGMKMDDTLNFAMV